MSFLILHILSWFQIFLYNTAFSPEESSLAPFQQHEVLFVCFCFIISTTKDKQIQSATEHTEQYLYALLNDTLTRQMNDSHFTFGYQYKTIKKRYTICCHTPRIFPEHWGLSKAKHSITLVLHFNNRSILWVMKMERHLK